MMHKLSRLCFGQGDDRGGVVIGLYFVASFNSAPFAHMCNHVVWRRALNASRFHHAAACCQSIARVHVNMFAPEASRAMIRISVAHDGCTAVLAGKIFLVARKCHTATLPTPRYLVAHSYPKARYIRA